MASLFKRLKRLKNLWDLAEENPKESKELEAQLFQGHATFLPDMDEEEMNTYVKEHEEGWGKFYEGIRKVLKT